MKVEHPNWRNILVIAVLVAVIGACGAIIWQHAPRSQALEIRLPDAPGDRLEGGIYLDGAVNRPGYYPLKPADSLADLLQAAGGALDGAEMGQLRLHIPEKGQPPTHQKVDINRAETWLLQALPGIGEVRAQAIVAYRQRHGPFRSTSELARVEGIGPETCEQLKALITVAQ